MSEEVKNVITDEQIAEAVKRVGELAKTRQEINTYKSELLTHQEDLENAKKVFGVGSSEYELQKGHVDNKRRPTRLILPRSITLRYILNRRRRMNPSTPTRVRRSSGSLWTICTTMWDSMRRVPLPLWYLF